VAKIGYARCSSQGQDLTIQQDRLRKAGCTIIRSEKVSGGSQQGRDELTSIMEFVREGDELVVLKLDRLGRNTRDVLNLVHDLRQKGAVLSVLEPKFATTDVAGPILVTVLGMVAELERSFIRERQKAGIDAAKKRGVYKGRKPTVPVEQVREMHKNGVGPSAIARELWNQPDVRSSCIESGLAEYPAVWMAMLWTIALGFAVSGRHPGRLVER
jgi:DNA invertase Pin-like site-specific DNA recombinase